MVRTDSKEQKLEAFLQVTPKATTTEKHGGPSTATAEQKTGEEGPSTSR